MSDPAFLYFGAAMTMGVCLTAGAGLKAWNDWLELRRGEIEALGSGQRSRRGRELAELRSRVKRLEAIANGIDR